MTMEWKQYILGQAQLHPSMEPQDVYKLMFQAAFGAEHLLKDKDAARAYFQREYEEVSPREEALYEQIQKEVYRVNLGAWKRKNLPGEWLFEMFVGSVEAQETSERQKQSEQSGMQEPQEQTSQQNFAAYVEIAKEAVGEGAFAFSLENFQQYSDEYEKEGPRAVHHSERYREAEKPAYRLVNGSYVRLIPILEKIAAYMGKNEKKIAIYEQEDIIGKQRKQCMNIAIDGRCASGKSTMAELLSEITGAAVVHMDDFFLPPELRTRERLNEPGGNVHYERFKEEVLPQLKTATEFAYRRFDCSKMQLGENRAVKNAPIRIVEGAYSCHPIFGDYADLKVFSDVESKEQQRRICTRDGEEMLEMFLKRWIPMEEKYIAAFHIKETADLHIL